MQCGCQEVVAVFQIDLDSSSCWRVEGGLAYLDAAIGLLLPQFQEACEQQVNKQKRKAVVAMVETFFGDFLILVLMDLNAN